MKYARVIVNISHENLDKTYEYAIPEEWEDKCIVGVQVVIPFGGGNRQIKGFVLEITDSPEFDPLKIKPIIGVITDGTVLECHFIQLAVWIKEQYGSTLNDALRAVLPVKKKMKEQEKRYLHLAVEREKLFRYMEECEQKNHKARLRLATALEEQDIIEYGVAIKEYNVSRDAINKLNELGILYISNKKTYRNPIKDHIVEEHSVTLTSAQQQVVDAIWEEYKQGISNTYLLHGVTGSGKTEVYMEIMEKVISTGKQVIFLIPEIALTVQMTERFYKRFGNRVSVLHSRLSDGERSDQYQRAQKGEIDIMIGPRSALFTPFEKIGMIVMDEEHETSYKSENAPKYHTREVAIQRAKMCGASILLGSATPSVESFYKARLGEYQLFTLKERVNGSKMPSISVVDLREELKKRNYSIFSRELKQKIEHCLQEKKQVLLFINRRGYAGFISCRACGHVMKCPHCDVALTEHNNGKLLCHYCGYEVPKPRVCPACTSKYIAAFGTGTQKVEEFVKKEFPNARVLRMDRDTTSRKGDYERILHAFEGQRADILIGTQMIVKGHDFSNVALVGAVAADLSLYANDYCSAERTFQLLYQAAGRAGRRSEPGEMIIQTYNPEHYSIEMVKEQNYEGFYEKEILYRTMLKYPPAGFLLVILLVSKDEKRTEQAALLLSEAAKEKLGKEKVVGPANASIYRISDQFRKVFYLKEESKEKLLDCKNLLEQFSKHSDYLKQVNVYYDLNPMTGY